MSKRFYIFSLAAAITMFYTTGCNDDHKSTRSEQPECASAKPDESCECIDGKWQNCRTTQECTTAKPDESCECIDGEWQNCNQEDGCTTEKPDESCECIGGEWQNCNHEDGCITEKPDESCECIGGEWLNCSIETDCPESMPYNASDCTCVDGTWQYCTYSCAETCTNGNTCDPTKGECNCMGQQCDANEMCTESGCMCGENVCLSTEYCANGDCLCNVDNRICGEFETCTEEGCRCQGDICEDPEICTETGCQVPKPMIVLSKEHLEIPEDGHDNDHSTITLNQKPNNNVTVSWEQEADGVVCREMFTDAHEVVLTTDNWNTGSVIYCQSSSFDSDQIVDNKTITRTFTATSDAAEWNGITNEISIRILDSDNAGFEVGCGTVEAESYMETTVWNCTQATTSEYGSLSDIISKLGISSTPYFHSDIALKLTANPQCNIKIEASIANDDGTTEPYGELYGELAASGVTFNAENWDKVQRIALKGKSDGTQVNTTPHTYTITLHPVVDSSCVDEWKALPDYTISVLNEDTEGASIFVNPGMDKIPESNQQVVSYVELNTEPGAETTLTAKIDPPTDRCTLLNGLLGDPVTEYKLTYTKDNYNEVQMLVVRSIDNEIDDGDAACNILLTGSSSDTNPETTYNGITKVIRKTVINDDIAGIKTVEYDSKLVEKKKLSGDIVNGEWQVQLGSRPLANVTITPEVKNIAEADKDVHLEVTSEPLVFTPENYNKPQSIRYKSVRDNNVSGDLKVTLSAKASSDDSKYHEKAESVEITIVDSDVASIVSSFDYYYPRNVLRERRPLEYQTIFLKLASTPTSDVTVTLKPKNNRITLSSTMLTTPATESKSVTFVIKPEKATLLQQAAYVYPVDNNKKDGESNTRITLTAASSDSIYDKMSAESVDVTVLDNEDPQTLKITCSGRAMCTNADNTSKCTFSLDQSNRPSGGDVYVYCDKSENIYWGKDFRTDHILLEKSNSYSYTTTLPIRSLQCDSNPQASGVATTKFTCHAEAYDFYAKGTGKIEYIYNE